MFSGQFGMDMAHTLGGAFGDPSQGLDNFGGGYGMDQMDPFAREALTNALRTGHQQNQFYENQIRQQQEAERKAQMDQIQQQQQQLNQYQPAAPALTPAITPAAPEQAQQPTLSTDVAETIPGTENMVEQSSTALPVGVGKKQQQNTPYWSWNQNQIATAQANALRGNSALASSATPDW